MQTFPPPLPRPLRCLEDCGHGVCSGPPDFTCMCDLGWTSDLPLPTPAPGPPAPRCSRDCGCNFHSHCHKRGPGFCDECQGELPSSRTPPAWPRGSFIGAPVSSSLRGLQCLLTQLWVLLPHCLLMTPDGLQCHPSDGASFWDLLLPQSGPWLPSFEAARLGQGSAEPVGQAPSCPWP